MQHVFCPVLLPVGITIKEAVLFTKEEWALIHNEKIDGFVLRIFWGTPKGIKYSQLVCKEPTISTQDWEDMAFMLKLITTDITPE